MDENFKVFDFHRIFIGQTPVLFLLEIVFRTIIMYTYAILLLRFLGKRGMGQLSTLELAIIICFGSAVGDPMVGAEVPILHGMVAITAVAILQISLERIINKNKKIENVMEGQPLCVVSNGIILLESLKKDNLSHADLYRSLRFKDVEQLGEIKKAYFETSGQISVIFQAPSDIRAGLSILPEDDTTEVQANPGKSTAPGNVAHSCQQCGYTKIFAEQQMFNPCTNCACDNWSLSKPGQLHN